MCASATVMDCFQKKEMDEKDLKIFKKIIERSMKFLFEHMFGLSTVRLLMMIIITVLLWVLLLRLGITRPNFNY